MLGGQIRSPKDIDDGDFRKNAPRFSEENFPKNLKLVDTITEIAKKKNATPSQLTLAWLLAQGDEVFPVRTKIVSVTSDALTCQPDPGNDQPCPP